MTIIAHYHYLREDWKWDCRILFRMHSYASFTLKWTLSNLSRLEMPNYKAQCTTAQ